MIISLVVQSGTHSFNTASGMDCMQFRQGQRKHFGERQFQYRKRYGLHAITSFAWPVSRRFCFNTASGMDCMQFETSIRVLKELKSFNTASGMDCMQYRPKGRKGRLFSVSIPQAVWIACNVFVLCRCVRPDIVSIPQAVWIACNTRRQTRAKGGIIVSIPQAVWIACNDLSREDGEFVSSFQYRKRYGLHAICRRSSAPRGISSVSIPQAVWIACNSPSERTS